MSSCFDVFPETIGVALDVDRRRVIEDPVEDRRSNHDVAINLVPLIQDVLFAKGWTWTGLRSLFLGLLLKPFF